MGFVLQAAGTAAPAGTSWLTPAGAQLNTNWPDLDDAVAAFVLALGAGAPTLTSHVVFRCGTVAAVRENDPEFRGYVREHDCVFPLGVASPEIIDAIRADNRRVWEKQSAIPGAAGAAIRRGYALLMAAGYPFPREEGEWRGRRTGVHMPATDKELWSITRDATDPRVTNLLLTNRSTGLGAVGDLRRNDYLFPEVAAVITSDSRLWKYLPDGSFGDSGL